MGSDLEVDRASIAGHPVFVAPFITELKDKDVHRGSEELRIILTISVKRSE
jgi:hypothetical protein